MTDSTPEPESIRPLPLVIWYGQSSTQSDGNPASSQCLRPKNQNPIHDGPEEPTGPEYVTSPCAAKKAAICSASLPPPVSRTTRVPSRLARSMAAPRSGFQ